MKFASKLIKLAAAAAAVAGIAYLVVRYFDDIKAWLSKFCPCCDYTLEDDFEVEVPMTEPVSQSAPADDPSAGECSAPDASAGEAVSDSESSASNAESEDSITAEEEDFEA